MTSTLEDIVTFHELKAQGCSISEIARATGRDRSRVMAPARLEFIGGAEALHVPGPPGTGKSHIAGPSA